VLFSFVLVIYSMKTSDAKASHINVLNELVLMLISVHKKEKTLCSL